MDDCIVQVALKGQQPSVPSATGDFARQPPRFGRNCRYRIWKIQINNCW